MIAQCFILLLVVFSVTNSVGQGFTVQLVGSEFTVTDNDKEKNFLPDYTKPFSSFSIKRTETPKAMYEIRVDSNPIGSFESDGRLHTIIDPTGTDMRGRKIDIMRDGHSFVWFTISSSQQEGKNESHDSGSNPYPVESDVAYF